MDDATESERIRAGCGIPQAAPLVLYVGQIGLRKGLDDWLCVAARVAAETGDAHFAIVGERFSSKAESIEYERRLRELAQRQPLTGRVHWLGTRSDVERLMRTADVLLHMARQEPLGRVLLESLASGLPTVATRVGGTPEILDHPDLDSLMVGVGDCEAAAGRVIELLRNPSRRIAIGRCMRKVAIEKFTDRRAANELASVYRQLTGTPDSRRRAD
jgi:glycosyltransferase involved in cell wall biosynthesis